MSDIDNTVFTGNLGADPVLNHTSTNNVAVCTIQVAINRYTGRGENRKEATIWLPVVLFRSQAEYAAQYGKKGSRVLVQGYHQTREWKDNEGKNQRQMEIVATEFKLL